MPSGRQEKTDQSTGPGRTLVEERRLNGGLPNSDVCALAFSKDGRYLAVARTDWLIQVFSLEQDWLEVFSVRHWNRITALALTFCPQGEYLAAGGDDRAVLVYAVKRDWEVVASIGARYAARAVSFSPCGSYLVAGVRHQEVQVLSVKNGWSVVATITFKGLVVGMTFNKGGNHLFLTTRPSVNGNTQVTLYDVQGGWTPVRKFTREDSITALEFSPAMGELFISGSTSCSVMKIQAGWPLDQETETVFQGPAVHADGAGAVFSPNGDFLALRADNKLLLHDARFNFEEKIKFQFEGQIVTTIGFSSCSKYFAMGADHDLIIYRVVDVDGDKRPSPASQFISFNNELPVETFLMLPPDEEPESCRSTPGIETLASVGLSVMGSPPRDSVNSMSEGQSWQRLAQKIAL
jgi:WD40 repeat protein